MEKFVEQAFEDAMEMSEEQEHKAFEEAIVQDKDILLLSVGVNVGLEKMEVLSKSVIDSGTAETLAEFVTQLSMICFHIGYREGRNSK